MSNHPDLIARRRAPWLSRVAVCASVVAALTGAMAGVQARASENRGGYLTTTDGTPVGAESACVRTREWVPGMYYRRCDAPQQKAALPVRVGVVRVPSLPIAPPEIRKTAVPFKVAVDTLFDFDQATLRPQGRALLDRFADRIRRADFQTIDIVGHADRIGSASYNQLLSERRARAVRDYLAAHGLASQKLLAEGKGSSEPVTSAGQCKGLRDHRLIDCLQPDRYAELKVSGNASDASASRAIMGLESMQTAALQSR